MRKDAVFWCSCICKVLPGFADLRLSCCRYIRAYLCLDPGRQGTRDIHNPMVKLNVKLNVNEQTIKQLLRIVTVLCQQNETNLHWLDALPAVEIAINNAPIASTPFSPYFINFGCHPCLLAYSSLDCGKQKKSAYLNQPTSNTYSFKINVINT